MAADLGLCFGVKKCSVCGREFREGEARYEVEGLGCVCWDCYEGLSEGGV